jgi:hypothetical protein
MRDPGNNFRNAKRLGNFVNRVEVIDGRIGGSNTGDMYRINILKRSIATIALTNLSANADIETYDSKRRFIRRFDNEGIDREYTSGDTPSGVYYIKVIPKSGGATDYRLTILTVDF